MHDPLPLREKSNEKVLIEKRYGWESCLDSL